MTKPTKAHRELAVQLMTACSEAGHGFSDEDKLRLSLMHIAQTICAAESRGELRASERQGGRPQNQDDAASAVIDVLLCHSGFVDSWNLLSPSAKRELRRDIAWSIGKTMPDPLTPSQPAPSADAILVTDWWASLARWCSVHAKDRRIGCNEYATGRWKVWVEWNDDAVETGSGASVEQAVADLCDKLATRHPSSALPAVPRPSADAAMARWAVDTLDKWQELNPDAHAFATCFLPELPIPARKWKCVSFSHPGMFFGPTPAAARISAAKALREANPELPAPPGQKDSK